MKLTEKYRSVAILGILLVALNSTFAAVDDCGSQFRISENAPNGMVAIDTRLNTDGTVSISIDVLYQHDDLILTQVVKGMADRDGNLYGASIKLLSSSDNLRKRVEYTSVESDLHETMLLIAVYRSKPGICPKSNSMFKFKVPIYVEPSDGA